MAVSRKGDELIIKLSENINTEILQRLIDYINYNELTSKSNAKQEEIDKLASSVNKGWWSKNAK